MTEDLSTYDYPLTSLFPPPSSREEGERYSLSDEQIEFYRENGYVAGIRMLDDAQLEVLREELSALADSRHPAHELFYEYHTNESSDASKILFHALGAWRIARGFH